MQNEKKKYQDVSLHLAAICNVQAGLHAKSK